MPCGVFSLVTAMSGLDPPLQLLTIPPINPKCTRHGGSGYVAHGFTRSERCRPPLATPCGCGNKHGSRPVKNLGERRPGPPAAALARSRVGSPGAGLPVPCPTARWRSSWSDTNLYVKLTGVLRRAQLHDAGAGPPSKRIDGRPASTLPSARGFLCPLAAWRVAP